MKPDALKPCRWARKYFATQRMQHVMTPGFNNGSICSEAADIYNTAEFGGTADFSQQLDRMGSSEYFTPCVTPGGVLVNFTKKRPVTGIEKFMLQGFPVHLLHLQKLSERATRKH